MEPAKYVPAPSPDSYEHKALVIGLTCSLVGLVVVVGLIWGVLKCSDVKRRIPKKRAGRPEKYREPGLPEYVGQPTTIASLEEFEQQIQPQSDRPEAIAPHFYDSYTGEGEYVYY